MTIKIEMCFAMGTNGTWLEFKPESPLPSGEHLDDLVEVSRNLHLPEGVVSARITTTEPPREVVFFYHPTYGSVPKLEIEDGEITMVYPTNEEVGGIWEIPYVLPDGNVIPLMYVEPAEAFEMGDDESPSRRTVSVPGGFMAKTPTTVRQWNWFAAANGKDLKATTVVDKNGKTIDLSDHPVVEVSYWDCDECAKWTGLGLPDEEQWERAARGNDGRKFPWGNEPPTLETCHSSVQVQQDRTDAVFNRPKGASPYGILDMSGNVWEWTSTIHQ